MDSDAIRQLVEQAVAAAVGQIMTARATAASTAATGLVPPAFSVNPAGAATTPWNFASGDGLKIYMSSIQALTPDKKYDGNQAGLCHFLDDVHERADSFGWLPILHVEDDDGNKKWIASEFGALKQTNLVAHATACMGSEDRKHQASECLKKLIKNSITPAMWDELKLQKDEYTVDVTLSTTATEKRQDGAMMLFTLTRIVAVESRSTMSSLLKQLNNMEKLMDDAKSDIKVFNMKVSMIMVGLKARKTEVPDILPHLFEACRGCGDKTFVEYIGRKEEAYEDGTLRDLTHDKLMRLAMEKCKALQDKNRWMQKSEAELEFIAMTARLEAVTKQLTQKKTPPRLKKKTDEPARKTPWPNDGEWKWKGEASKAGEATEKQFKGRWHVHCPHHGDTQWVLRDKKGVPPVRNCNARKKAESGHEKHVAMQAGLQDLSMEDEDDEGNELQLPEPDEATVTKCLATLLKMADK